MGFMEKEEEEKEDEDEEESRASYACILLLPLKESQCYHISVQCRPTVPS